MRREIFALLVLLARWPNKYKDNYRWITDYPMGYIGTCLRPSQEFKALGAKGLP